MVVHLVKSLVIVTLYKVGEAGGITPALMETFIPTGEVVSTGQR